jgi:membrane glycosyltransferase
MPPTLLDELQRDRRWCQGNLMNFRLSLLNGLHAAHRAVFVSGVMAYASGLLWLLFLLLSTALVAMHSLHTPIYFFGPYQLFPIWPEWHPQWALTLVGATAVLLYVPKLLAVLAVALRDPAHYGGRPRLLLSMVGEMLLSALLAPVRMLFHSQFVLGTLAGWGVAWRSPPRDDAATSWCEAARRHGVHTLAGLGWAAVVYWLQPAFLWWLLPVLGALILSIPVSVLSSRAAVGRRLRRLGLFVIPEECDPPREISALVAALRRSTPLPGFAEAVTDPAVARLVCAAGHARERSAPAVVAQRQGLVDAALARGPQGLTPAERLRLLGDPAALSLLHRNIRVAAAPLRWSGSAVPAPA